MGYKKFLSLLVLTFVCYFGGIASAWADDTPPSIAEVEELRDSEGFLVDDEGSLGDDWESSEPKSWEQGFELRLNLGIGTMVADASQLSYVIQNLAGDISYGTIDGYFAGQMSYELGYRWKYGGIYLNMGIAIVDVPKTSSSYGFNDEYNNEYRYEYDTDYTSAMPMFVANLLGKFYVPLTYNTEFIIDAGFGWFSLLTVLYLGAGIQWHHGGLLLGFELIYQRELGSIAYLLNFNINLLHGTFVIGYTF